MSGHESTYEPKTGFTKWLDSRLPIVRLAHDSFVDFPTPKNLNYWYTFGGILAICLAIQIVTGIVLAMHYEASVEGAFASVERIMRDVPYGWLLRYVHANGASFFFLAVYIHMFRGLYYGSYKAPREVLWLLGCVIFLLMIITAFLGYMLPWGQMSYHGANVITGLIGALPLVGEPIQTWLMGGPSIGNATLQRFFSLHYLLPFVIAGVVILHIWALHVPGNNNPTGVEVQDVEKDTVPFHPYYTVKDGFAIVVFLVIFAVFVFYMPNVLGHADNYIEANPLVTPAHIVPEWYLLPFYAILRAITFDIGPIDAKLLGVIAMFASIAMLFLLPWMDTSKVKSMRYRPVARQFFFGFVICGLLLSWCGAANPDDPLIPMGKDKIEISYSEYGPEATETFSTEEAAIEFENGLAENVEITRKKLAEEEFTVTYKTLIADDGTRTFENWTDADAFRNNDLPPNAIASQPVVVKAPAFRMVHLAQILTAYYFGYFFILMFLGLRETPKEEPASIHKSVLGSKAAAPVAAE